MSGGGIGDQLDNFRGVGHGRGRGGRNLAAVVGQEVVPGPQTVPDVSRDEQRMLDATIVSIRDRFLYMTPAGRYHYLQYLQRYLTPTSLFPDLQPLRQPRGSRPPLRN